MRVPQAAGIGVVLDEAVIDVIDQPTEDGKDGGALRCVLLCGGSQVPKSSGSSWMSKPASRICLRKMGRWSLWNWISLFAGYITLMPMVCCPVAARMRS